MGMLRAGWTCRYVLHVLSHRRLATLLSLPEPLLSRGRVQTNRQASALVHQLAIYS
jgi:hypothetical protein